MARILYVTGSSCSIPARNSVMLITVGGRELFFLGAGWAIDRTGHGVEGVGVRLVSRL